MTAAAPDTGFDPVAAVEAWRRRHAHTVDPVRFAIVAGLARRAAAQQGEARRLIVLRLERLLADAAVVPPAAPPHPAGAALAGLSALVDRLGRTPAAPRAPGAPLPRRVAPPAPLKALTTFGGTWSRLRAEQRLRQALAQVPERAGPLNSSHLVHGALRAMHRLSPAYLDAFMAHVDTLLWLEQASGGGGGEPPGRADGGRRPGSRAARKG